MAPRARAMSSGNGCMSTAVISLAPARFRTATMSAPIGPAPITRADLPWTSPAWETACQATAAGSAKAASRTPSPAGSGLSILLGRVAYLTNAPSRCGKRAALPR